MENCGVLVRGNEPIPNDAFAIQFVIFKEAHLCLIRFIIDFKLSPIPVHLPRLKLTFINKHKFLQLTLWEIHLFANLLSQILKLYYPGEPSDITLDISKLNATIPLPLHIIRQSIKLTKYLKLRLCQIPSSEPNIVIEHTIIIKVF